MKTFNALCFILLIFLLTGWINLSFAASNDLNPSKTLPAAKTAPETDKPHAIQEKTGKGLPASQKPSPGPVLEAPTKKVPHVAPTPTPLLRIQEVYLEKNRLHVVIRNTGKGKLSAADYMKGRLVVGRSGSKVPWNWTLIKVDPKRTSFKEGVDFDTGKAVTERASFAVWIEHVPTGKPWKGFLLPAAPLLMKKKDTGGSDVPLVKPAETERLTLSKKPMKDRQRPRDLWPAPSGSSESLSPMKGTIKPLSAERAAEIGVQAPERPLRLGPAATTLAAPRTGTLEISWFKKCVPPDTFVHPSAMGRDESTDEPFEITVDHGESVDLCWRIAGSGVSDVRATLSWYGEVDPGERVETESGGFYMRGNMAIRPQHGRTSYTLGVSGNTALYPVTREKTVVIRIRSARLSVAEPSFDQETGEITFHASNTGELPLEPAPIRVHYSYRPSLGGEHTTGDITSDPIGIEPGGTVEVGSLTLPWSVFESPSLSMQITMSCRGHASMITEFDHTWETHTRRLAASILGAVLGDIDIRLNNYDPSVRTGDRFVGMAYAPNECHLQILDYSNNFTLSPFSRVYSVGDRIYGVEGFVRNLDLGSNHVETTFSSGRISIRIPFETSDDPREIKVFVYRADRLPWERVDSWGPDANLTNLEITVTLRPVLEDQIITYASEIEVDVDISSEFAGGWSFLDRIAPQIGRDLRDSVKDLVEEEIVSKLGSATIKGMIEAQIAAFLDDAQHIVSLQTTSEGMQILYR